MRSSERTRTEPDNGDLPEALGKGFYDAFSISHWIYDRKPDRLYLPHERLVEIEVPREVLFTPKYMTPSLKGLHDWLVSCAPGDAATVHFTDARNPFSVRVYCAEQDEDRSSGFFQDLSDPVLRNSSDARFRMALEGAAQAWRWSRWTVPGCRSTQRSAPCWDTKPTSFTRRHFRT